MKNKLILMFVLLVAVICIFTACNKIEKFVYPSPTNISYDGEYITWDKCEGANYYNVSINGGTAMRSNSTTYMYSSSDTIEVTVTAVYSEYEQPESATFRPLAKIDTLIVSDNGEVSWNTVSGANAYNLSVNGQTLTVTDTVYNNLKEGSNRIKVMPIVSGDKTFYSKWSAESSIYIYTAPTNVKYDGEELSWSGNAASYEIDINGTKEIVTGNKFSYRSDNKDFKAEVKSLGDHKTTFDSKSATEEFYYLDTINSLIVQDGVLNWSEVKGAEGYKIKINGVEQKSTVSTTSFDKLAAGSSLRVSVKPFNNGGNYFSNWSHEKVIYLLPIPEVNFNTDVNFDGSSDLTALYWDSINGAYSYQVIVEKDGKVVDTKNISGYDGGYQYGFIEVGEYKVKVKAVAETGTDYYDSKFSNPINVNRLPAPVLEKIESDDADLSRGFTVSYKQVTGAAGYKLYREGAELNSSYVTSKTLSITDTGFTDIKESTQQNYDYYILSMGSDTGNGVKTVKGEIYVTLPCLTSGALKFKIKVQAMPENLDMNGFKAEWSNVSGANGYMFDVDGIGYICQSTTYDLQSLSRGNHTIKVCARGNGGDVLASQYTSVKNIERLEAPSGIKFTFARAGGRLEYNSVANADSYDIYLDGTLQNFTEDDLNNMCQFFKTTGTNIDMSAVCNRWKGGTYYMTSERCEKKMFFRLAKPTFPKGAFGNRTEIIWEAPNNTNQEFSPAYEVKVNNIAEDNLIHGEKMSLVKYDGGKEYTFTVRAIGNDDRYLTSEESDPISVYKLSTPKFEIDVEKRAYTWNNISELVLPSTYRLEIDGVKCMDTINVNSEYMYQPDFKEEKTYNVKLYAVGDGIKSIDSNPYEYNQKTKKHIRPEFTKSYDPETREVTVSIINSEKANMQFCYEIDGQTIISDETTCVKRLENSGIKKIRVKALGGDFDNNGVYFTESAFTDEERLTILGAPNKSVFMINGNGVINWSSYNEQNVLSYNYMIKLGEGEFSEVVNTRQKRTDIIDENFVNRSYTTVTIKIQVVGDEINIFSSEWVEITINV